MSVVDFGGVEISSEVGFTFRGDGVVTSLFVNNLYKSEISKSFETAFESNLVHIRRFLCEIVVNHRRRLCNADFCEVLKDGIVFLVHPMSPPAHTLRVAGAGAMILLLKDSVEIIQYPSRYCTVASIISLPPYRRDNDCRDGSGDDKSLRAGVIAPNPVVANSMNTNDPRALKRPQDEDDGSPTTHFDARNTLAGRYDRVRLGGDNV